MKTKTVAVDKVLHGSWLVERGYHRYKPVVIERGALAVFSRRLEDEYNIGVRAYNTDWLEHGTRYEVEAQLYGDITMNITLFTLFDKDLQSRLAGIEAYVIELTEFHKGKQL